MVRAHGGAIAWFGLGFGLGLRVRANPNPNPKPNPNPDRDQVLPLFFVTWWNVFFSALPVIVYGFQDQDVSKDVSAEAVELYSKGLKREFYTHAIFARWCAEAFYMGLVCSVAPMLSMVLLGCGDAVGNDGQPVDLSVLGVAIMVNVTVCVNLRFALEGHSFGKHSSK